MKVISIEHLIFNIIHTLENYKIIAVNINKQEVLNTISRVTQKDTLKNIEGSLFNQKK